MNKYLELKDIIIRLLLEEPEDMVDETGEWWESQFETKEPRQFEEEDPTKRIGSKNILEGLQLVFSICEQEVVHYPKVVTNNELEKTTQEIFSKIIKELEKDGIIRFTPESRRRGFKVIDGNKEENNITD